MTRYVLGSVDFNRDFSISNGALYVPEAEGILPAAQDFLDGVKPGTFEFALVQYDTHFSGEYPHSPESVPFPSIHCEYDTWGWELLVAS